MPCRYSRYAGDWAAGAFGTVRDRCKEVCCHRQDNKQGHFVVVQDAHVDLLESAGYNVIFRSARGDGRRRREDIMRRLDVVEN